MTLRDLLGSGLVKDDTMIIASTSMSGTAAEIRKGEWFSDRIMGLMECEIRSLKWEEGGFLFVSLRQEKEARSE